MSQRPDLNQLSPDQLRALATELMASLESKEQALSLKDRALVHRDAVIEKLTHEVAILKRHKYAQRSEQLDAVQGNLLDELIGGDLAAIEAELAQLTVDETPAKPKKQPKRAPLSPELPRTLIHPEPESTLCCWACTSTSALTATSSTPSLGYRWFTRHWITWARISAGSASSPTPRPLR